MPLYRVAIEPIDSDPTEPAYVAPSYTAPAPTGDPAATPSTGSTGTGDLSTTPSTSDPTTGGDGSGSGALSPQIAPAVVIGMDMVRQALGVEPPVSVAPEVTLVGVSKDRRKRSTYTERTPRPSVSGINL